MYKNYFFQCSLISFVYMDYKKKKNLPQDKKKVALLALERKRKYHEDLKELNKRVWNEKRF